MISTLWLSFFLEDLILHLALIHCLYTPTNFRSVGGFVNFFENVSAHLLCFHLPDIGVGHLSLDLLFLLV